MSIDFDSDPKYQYILYSDEQLFSSFGDSENLERLDIFFESFLSILIERSHKLSQLTDPLAYATYFEMILIQIRAIAIESARYKNNITIHNYLLKKLGGAGVDTLNQYLSQPIDEQRLDGPMTLSEALKIVVDKSIAHYDEPNSDDVFTIDYLKMLLADSSHRFYICNIVDSLEEIIRHNTNLRDKEIWEKHIKRGKDLFGSLNES